MIYDLPASIAHRRSSVFGLRSPFVHCSAIQRAAHAAPTTIEGMGGDHRRLDILVAEQFLHGADVVAIIVH